MREIAEVKEILRVVLSPLSLGPATQTLIRWPKHSPPLYSHRLSFGPRNEHLCETEMLTEDLSAADIAKEALHAIEQLELPRLAEQQRIAELERDLAAERAFIKRLMGGLRR